MTKKNTSKQKANDATEFDSGNSNKRVALRRDGIFNRNEMITILGISPEKFQRLVRDGGPVISRSSADEPNIEWRIKSSDFIEFMIEDACKRLKGSSDEGMSYEDAKRKDKEVQANMREMELLKKQAQLVDIEDVRPFLREVFATTRSRFLSIVSQVIGLSHNQKRDLEDAVNDALADLSEGRVGEWNNEQAPAHAHH